MRPAKDQLPARRSAHIDVTTPAGMEKLRRTIVDHYGEDVWEVVEQNRETDQRLRSDFIQAALEKGLRMLQLQYGPHRDDPMCVALVADASGIERSIAQKMLQLSAKVVKIVGEGDDQTLVLDSDLVARLTGTRTTITHIYNALPLDDPETMIRYLTEAGRENMSVHDFKLMIEAASGAVNSKVGGGRRPHIPDDPIKRLIAFRKANQSFANWLSTARSEGDWDEIVETIPPDDPRNERLLAELNDRRLEIDRIDDSIASQRQAIEGAIAKLEARLAGYPVDTAVDDDDPTAETPLVNGDTVVADATPESVTEYTSPSSVQEVQRPRRIYK